MPGQGRMWHKEVYRLVNFYNTAKPHCSLNGDTSFEVLQASFSTCGVNNATFSYRLWLKKTNFPLVLGVFCWETLFFTDRVGMENSCLFRNMFF